jgi:hypothetical protein
VAVVVGILVGILVGIVVGLIDVGVILLEVEAVGVITDGVTSTISSSVGESVGSNSIFGVVVEVYVTC